MSKIDRLLSKIAEAPSDQIPETVTTKIKRLVGVSDEIVATELKEIIDFCRSSPISKFGRHILDSAYWVVMSKDQV